MGQVYGVVCEGLVVLEYVVQVCVGGFIECLYGLVEQFGCLGLQFCDGEY